MRRNKGDVTYYLESELGVYHFIKKIKCRSRKITEGNSNSKKKTLSDFYFNVNEFDSIDFTSNGLRLTDKKIILHMIEKLKEDDHDN